MASLSEIRWKVSEQERINSQLRQELAQLQNGINQASNKWNQLTSNINNTLVNGESRVRNSHELTLKAYEIQLDIERLYKLYKNIELANKKIRACQDKIYYEFANYNAVRKIVEAMLNNIEVSFVSNETITKAVEVKHLQLPDYWLTCALLAIMAWRNDDRELADKALQRACKLDLKNASIFFFAFHMRIHKELVALKWFNSYISCERTGEDNKNILFMFSIISKSIAEECGDEMYTAIDNFVNNIIQERLKEEGYSEEELVERIRGYLSAMRINDAVDYPFLSKYCKEMSFLTNELMLAKNNIRILEFIRKTANVTSNGKIERLNAFIDDIIARANTSENDVRNEIHYNELVISNKGDVEIAKEQNEQWLEHNRTQLDILSEMVNWVYNPGEFDVGPFEKQKMFIITKNLSQKAVQRNVESYRSCYKRNFDVKINEYETNADFTNENGELRKIESYFSEKAQRLIAMEKTWPCFVWFGAGVLATVGAIATSTPALLVGTLAGIAGGVLKIFLTKRKKENIQKDCEIASANTKTTFTQLIADFSKYEDEYREYDAYFDEIEDEFSKL